MQEGKDADAQVPDPFTTGLPVPPTPVHATKKQVPIKEKAPRRE